MKREAFDPNAPLPVRALYTVRELAEAASLSRFRVHRLLRSLGVTMIRSGRIYLVPLDELEQKAPRLWNSLRTAEYQRALS
jgi:hypothetical protein